MPSFFRLFENSIQASQNSYRAVSEDSFAPSDFYREVLLSYRLIFDEPGGSRPWLKDDHTCTRRVSTDRLLQRLCTPKCAKEPLYTAIQAPLPKSQYTASKDFPFLGQRLDIIQRYIVGKNPADLPAMLRDRRDTCK